MKWADEVIVVDSFSTDRTLEIAGGYTDRIFQREYRNDADQLNWVIPRAEHEWVLVVDSDERITPDLINEIRSLNLDESRVDGYRIKRANCLFGKRMHFSGWGRDWVMRLFKRDIGRKENKRVHGQIRVPSTACLNHQMQHYPVESMEVWVEKINRYTTWKAMDKMEKGNAKAMLNLFFRPPLSFFKDMVLRLGFLDGWRGFLVSAMSSFAGLVLSAKMLQLQMQRNRGKDGE